MEEGATAAAYLPDDVVVDILARLPAMSLCCFKCVSRRWRRLISDPAHRARLTQTLSGFFFVSCDPARCFAGLPSSVTPPAGDGGPPPVDASLSFLPASCVEGEIKMLDSCNGLLCCYMPKSPSSQYGLKTQKDIDSRGIRITNGPMR